MRVITGSARGRRLQTLQGDDVRPTVERVKEAIFSIIQFEIEGRKVLDLFGGSGQLGIEALSRGAESATFIDADKNSVSVIRENLKTTNLSDKASVLCADALSFLRMTEKRFDIVFIDPPYGTGLLQKALVLAAEKVSSGAVIICESPYNEELPEKAGENMPLYRSYKYGKVKITVYRWNDDENSDMSGQL